MSFILDALKKLEREKEAREPGLVMVRPVPWGESDRRRRGPGLAVAGTVLVLVLAGSFLWLRSGDDRSAAPNESGEPSSSADEAKTPTLAGSAQQPAAPVPEAQRPDGPGQTPLGVTPPPPRALHPGDPTAPLTEEAAPVEVIRSDAPPGDPAPPTNTPPEPEFRLTAISSRDGHPIALLNDRLVREGDRFGEVTILKINETSVDIEVAGERRTIGF